MKKTQFIELLHIIKSTIVSFISITLFITLSAAIYVGISGTSTSSLESMNDVIVDTKYHDLQVTYPLGMSSSDLEKIKNVEGVDEVEGTYTGYAYFAINNDKFQTRFLTLNDSLDKYISYNGELPKEINEIGVDEFFALEHGLSIGDKISFIPDKNNPYNSIAKIFNYDVEQDDIGGLININADKIPYLKSNEFIITSLMRSPDYTYKASTTYGVSPENDLQIDCFMYLSKASFNQDALPGYTNILIKSNSLSSFYTFSSKYQQKVKELIEKVKIEAIDDITNEKYGIFSDKIEAIVEYNQERLNAAKSMLESLIGKKEEIEAFGDEKALEEICLEIESLSNNYSMGCDFLNKFKNITKGFKEINATIISRDYNAGFVIENTMCQVLNKSRFSMAALFVVVGLFVCYSAICRIVNSQIINIGTKKALGISSKDITFSYLLYAIIAVIVGCIFGSLIGYYGVERLLMMVLFKNNAYPPVFAISWISVLLISAINFVLLVLTTFLGCRKILKKNAKDLLAGPQITKAKERFFEKTKFWEKLSLYTKTILNNFLNDSRRVIGTIVGIAGSTALVVAALTLNNSISNSFVVQYRDYFHFDSFITYDCSMPNSKEEIENVLNEFEIENTDIFYTTAFLKNPSDQYFYFNIMVPNNVEEFNELVNLVPTKNYSGDTNVGLWIPNAYQQFFKTTQNDSITLMTMDGKESTIKPGGYFNYHLLVYNGVMDKESYTNYFGNEVQSNSFIVNTKGKNVEQLKERLNTIEGFKKYSDYYETTNKSYRAFASVSQAMVGVCLAVSTAMVFLVVLNLLILFIKEKERELIILMINGFTIKQAKRYIYTDTIFLTVVSIILGCVLGSLLGDLSIRSFESESTAFIHGVDLLACLIGAFCTVIMTSIVTIIALKKVDKFTLTDINKE